MVKVSYKDVIIILLVVSQMFLIFHIMFKGEDNPGGNYFLNLSKDNLSNCLEDDVNEGRELEVVKVNNSKNFSKEYNVTDNRVEYSEINVSNSMNEKYIDIDNRFYKEMNNSKSVNGTYNNTWYPRKNICVKNVSLNELFLDLPYSKVIKISENGKKGIVKIYEKDGRVVNFDVRNYKPNLDNPRYVKVSKERRPFKYGIYYRYKYTVQYKNNTSVNYCYYREVGNYHIIMGFDREDKFIKDMWLRWNEYIEGVLYQ